MSSSIQRTLRNLWKNGFKKSFKQLQGYNDIKSGRLVGTDSFGNKFYEVDDPVEIHMRTRFVEYTGFWRQDMSEVEPGWHYWLAYGTDVPPNQLKPEEKSVRAYPVKKHVPNLTYTDGAYVPYNTARPKCATWDPKVTERP
ncbi:Subunit of mitochondrial NADH:ubiquinone oxidoreductase (complex I) [Komagataella phaffii CBS 7435]|uniref:NADH dehydrogenase [ubiquinone] 1 alpha subcomplex subunit n=3 Tax=Komagataella TaxID=460517 RepID=C4QVK1_KOMPG|nr:Hypothetical protein PAS_chr1-3_0210 [Komagataella phaffii GS115]AOA60866.1 GQ67_02470T0 [Komagataella phaffii]CAH2445930.1 Subunit of mitochondrial NADHubiquinone oxidoreductase (complex I) [Komagataella phaffii CBS 7435]CBI83567.1 N7BM (B17.2) subunit of mitochondrial NADH:ubiquinone oxidoreductase (complex I) [Komagataella pastoris]AOA66770.1 GQ68_02777T0 [Komagataella phaffii GS115]CAY67274.1 Hypothetical protein PAS_chr1-3_0210 [Komagataella phaffii GS115]